MVQSFEHNASNVNRTWKTGSISSAVLHDNRCVQVALQLATRLHKREIPLALEHLGTSLLWETSEYRALMHLPQVFVVHLHQCQCGSLSRRASIIILGHIDPHHLLRLRRKCHSGRGHCTCSDRLRASADRARTCDLTREIVFVFIDDTRMRQFSSVWTRRCTRSDVLRFRAVGFLSSLNFA